MVTEKEASDSQKGSQKGEKRVPSAASKAAAAAKPAGRGKGRPAGRATGRKVVSRSTKAGLAFPVGRIARYLKKGKYASRLGTLWVYIYTPRVPLWPHFTTVRGSGIRITTLLQVTV